MRTLRFAPLVAAAALAGGCFDVKPYDCQSRDDFCAQGERCIALTGGHGSACAKHDTGCPSGYRFGSTAPTANASACVDLGGKALPCTTVGDKCDDGDACTLDDTCQQDMTGAVVCGGTPMDCGPPSCAMGVQTNMACMMGQCVSSTMKCDPYGCNGNACATRCAKFEDCSAGYYCDPSGLCSSCTDFLSNSFNYPAFSDPQPLPGAVDLTGSTEDSPTLAADRLTLYYASDAKTGSMGGFDLYTATRPSAATASPFGSGMPLAALNSTANDIDPFTPDGMTMWLASDRSGEMMLYSSTMAGGSFGAPVAAMALHQKGFYDAAPSLTADGKRLYFESNRTTSMAPGDPWPQIYAANRADASSPFSGAAAVNGLGQPLADWSSPSVLPNGQALFLVNRAIGPVAPLTMTGKGFPGRSEIAVAHVDPSSGDVVGNVTVLANVADISTGTPTIPGRVSISPDGCMLLYGNKNGDPGNIYYSVRTTRSYCQNVGPGTADGCCPSATSGLIDPDCPFPRTNLVAEYFSMTDNAHDYLLVGEKAPTGYVATGNYFRVFADNANGAGVPLNRFANTSTNLLCAGKPYYYVGTEASRAGFTKTATLGYVFLGTQPLRGTSQLRRAREESNTGPCDMQVTTTALACAQAGSKQGWLCDPPGGSTGFGPFGVLP